MKSFNEVINEYFLGGEAEGDGEYHGGDEGKGRLRRLPDSPGHNMQPYREYSNEQLARMVIELQKKVEAIEMHLKNPNTLNYKL